MRRQKLEAEFVRRLKKRWARGARDYGDASFEAPLPKTVAEILCEIEDIAGWSFILWVQLKRRLDNMVEVEHGRGGAVAKRGRARKARGSS